jgi:hypothetical protein
MSNGGFTDCERAAITLQLAGDPDSEFRPLITSSPCELAAIKLQLADNPNIMRSKLRKQFETSEVANRGWTGVGFFTEIQVVDSSSTLSACQSFEMHDVSGATDALNYGIAFILFVRNGVLFAIEGATFEELWPPVGATIVLRNSQMDLQQTVTLT